MEDGDGAGDLRRLQCGRETSCHCLGLGGFGAPGGAGGAGGRRLRRRSRGHEAGERRRLTWYVSWLAGCTEGAGGDKVGVELDDYDVSAAVFVAKTFLGRHCVDTLQYRSKKEKKKCCWYRYIYAVCVGKVRSWL